MLTLSPRENYFFRGGLPRSSACLPRIFRGAAKMNFRQIHKIHMNIHEQVNSYEFA